MAVVNAQSLYQAIQDKYCFEFDEADRLSPDYVHVSKTGGCPMQRRKSLVIDQSGVACVGDKDKLHQLCPVVEEAHFGGNNLTQWEDVLDILHSMPKLSFLDLTSNPLISETFASSEFKSFPNMTVLVLNYTNIEWSALEVCLQFVSNLTELHLAHNKYSTIEPTPGLVYPSLKQLHIQENCVKDWSELAKVSDVFVNLQTLIASGNPLSSIAQIDCKIFPELLKLSLNSTLLREWHSFESLAHLAKLQELNVLRTPVCEGLEDKIRRYAIVARMPTLSKLNKSEVTPIEREDAERWLLREFEHCPKRPAVYDNYMKKHGALDPLVNVNLTPPTRIRLEFHFKNIDGRSPECHEVSLKQTVRQLKKWVGSELLGIPTSSVKLQIQYTDAYSEDWHGLEVMRLEQKYLHSYKHLKNGDRIYVRL